MDVAYFPGCTLKTTAKRYEDSALFIAGKLGVNLVELPRWNCCGTVYSLSTDNLMQMLAPMRVLLRTEEMGYNHLVTLCAMCFNTLKRANLRLRNNPEDAEKLNDFMYLEETKYSGRVEVIHFLEILVEKAGEIKDNLEKTFSGVKIAPYYGCLLVRPEEVGIDSPELPTVMEDVLHVAGFEVVDFPLRTECCGAYTTVNSKDLVISRTERIVRLASEMSADAIAVTCPLCEFNLDVRQLDAKEIHPDLPQVPIVYFTQLIALAMGATPKEAGFSQYGVSPEKLLEKCGLSERSEVCKE